MDYNADPDLIMFSNLQAVDGYNWASNISWAQVGPANSVPVAYDISSDAYINESCGIGGQMMGEIYPDKKNLSLSSVGYLINGNSDYSDPQDPDAARNVMLGFRKDGTVYPDSLAGSSYNQNLFFMEIQMIMLEIV